MWFEMLLEILTMMVVAKIQAAVGIVNGVLLLVFAFLLRRFFTLSASAFRHAKSDRFRQINTGTTFSAF